MKGLIEPEDHSKYQRLVWERIEPVVLLVEDDADTRDFMAKALKTDDIPCVTASSVAEALAALTREKIAVTVLDWGLDRSGAEVLRVAKELYPLMPVIAMSGLPFDVRTDAVVHQADAFLQKPFSATVLISQVRQFIERARQTPAILLPRRAEDICRLDEIKAIYIRHVVELFDGSISPAAEALGVHRQTVSAVLRKDVATNHHPLLERMARAIEPAP
jgi:DNA-binding response OmpR family regulator